MVTHALLPKAQLVRKPPLLAAIRWRLQIEVQQNLSCYPCADSSGRTILPLPQRFPPNILAGTLREGDRGLESLLGKFL